MLVVNSKMSAADMMSDLETDTGQRGAGGSHEEEQGADGSHDEQRRADGSNEDEKKLRDGSHSVFDYVIVQ